MINQLTVMLYVTNVEETATFWETYLGFTREQTLELGPSTSIVLGNNHNFSIQLFESDFIKQVSPEVSTETPSLMLKTANLEVLHTKLKTAGTFVSDITDLGGQHTFNFADNEGRYFACTESN